MPGGLSFIRWFSDIGLSDVPLVGGENASPGELYRQLSGAGVRVPNGFAVTAGGYRYFMQGTGLAAQVKGLLRGLEVTNLADLAERGLAIRQAITAAEIPAVLPTMRLVADAEAAASRPAPAAAAAHAVTGGL